MGELSNDFQIGDASNDDADDVITVVCGTERFPPISDEMLLVSLYAAFTLKK